VLYALGSEALDERIEPGDAERDPARARPRRVRLDEERGVLVDLLENLVPGAKVRGSPEEPRVPVDAGVEIRYRDTGVEVGNRAHPKTQPPSSRLVLQKRPRERCALIGSRIGRQRRFALTPLPLPREKGSGGDRNSSGRS
jgi:hypothetical protein